MVIENGGQGPNGEYSWKQTDDELSVTIKLDRPYRSRELNIAIETNHLLVAIKGQPPIIDASLSGQVKKSLSTWWIEDENVEFTLHKVLPGNWASLIPGHPEVDLDLLEGSKYLDDSLLQRIQNERKAQKEAAAAAAATGTSTTAEPDDDESAATASTTESS